MKLNRIFSLLFGCGAAMALSACAERRPSGQFVGFERAADGIEVQCLSEGTLRIGESDLANLPTKSAYRTFAESTLGNIDGARSLTAPVSLMSPPLVDRLIRKCYQTESAKIAARRSEIGTAVLASEQLCGAYLQLLTETDREGNMLLGGLTTVLGGLGAIFTPAATARALAGAAGITSGLRGDFNAAFFYQQTVGALAKAIRARREPELKAITDKLTKEYDVYPYTEAFADVERMHGGCSLQGAFDTINDALRRTAEPISITAAFEAHLKQAQLINQIQAERAK